MFSYRSRLSSLLQQNCSIHLQAILRSYVWAAHMGFSALHFSKFMDVWDSHQNTHILDLHWFYSMQTIWTIHSLFLQSAASICILYQPFPVACPHFLPPKCYGTTQETWMASRFYWLFLDNTTKVTMCRQILWLFNNPSPWLLLKETKAWILAMLL